MVLVAVGGDAQHGVPVGEGAPQRAALPRGAPARLVHVEVLGGPDALLQVVVRVFERVRDARQDRVDGAGADPRSEQLLAQLNDVTAADAVAGRQHRQRGVIARPERAVGHPNRQLSSRPGAAVRAAHALTAMLGHRDGNRRQLLDLMTRRHIDGDQLVAGKLTATTTTRRPVIDELINRPRRQQRPALALMTRLGALLGTRRVLAPLRRRARRVLARRLRGVARVATKPAFQLGDALLLTGDPLSQRLDLGIHAQQHRDHHLAALLVNRLRLDPLHTTGFDTATLCPPTH